MRLSKTFYVTSWAVAGGALVLLAAGAFGSILRNQLFDAGTLLGFALFPLLYLCICMSILWYNMWDAIQDGHGRTTPAKAIGLLFVPFFNFYWVFQVLWGFAQDYNRYLNRHSLRLLRLPEGMFLAYTILCVVSIVPGIGLLTGIVAYFIGLDIVSRICEAVNGLPANRLELGPQTGARGPWLHCVTGEFAGNMLVIPSEGIVIGRDPAHSHLVLRSLNVSAKHVHIWPDRDRPGLWVADMQSIQGTWWWDVVDGEPKWIRLSEPRFLNNGARFRLGADTAEFAVTV